MCKKTNKKIKKLNMPNRTSDNYMSNRKIKRCGMVANKRNLNQRPNDVEVNTYRSLYSLKL